MASRLSSDGLGNRLENGYNAQYNHKRNQAKTSVKQAFLLAGKQVANKLGKSTGKQREDVDKAPIDGEFRAIYNNKIETV